jgi:hypothetical protein
MPDEVFSPGQSHRDHMMRVAEQAHGGAKEKAESSKTIPNLPTKNFHSSMRLTKRGPLPPVASHRFGRKLKLPSTIAIKHQIACLQGAGCNRELHPLIMTESPNIDAE